MNLHKSEGEVYEELNYGKDFKSFLISQINDSVLLSVISKLLPVLILGILILSIFEIRELVPYLNPLQFIIGILCSFFVIPIHEGIHAITYILFGYRNIKFKRMGLIFTTHIPNQKVLVPHYKDAARAPFLVVSTLGIISLLILPNYLSFFMGLLLSHTYMCLGDFSILNYLEKNKLVKEVYDDMDNQILYIYK